MKTVRRGVRAFGHFWWDFLVGDTPELTVATLVIVGLAFVLRHQRDVAFVVLPLLTVVILLTSTLRGRRGSSNSP